MAKNLLSKTKRDFFTEFNVKKNFITQSEQDYQIDDPFELLNDVSNIYDEYFEPSDFLFENENTPNDSLVKEQKSNNFTSYKQNNVFQALENIRNSRFTSINSQNISFSQSIVKHVGLENSINNTGSNSFDLNSNPNNFRAVNELEPEFRSIFNEFKLFNRVQSLLFDELIHTNNSLVISAPTGSGKTTILELGIIRVLTLNKNRDFKIIYLAPLKALCNEKFTDWRRKFTQFNLKCIELTGDTDSVEEFTNLETANIICTTPEKWDIITRRYKKRRALMASVKLFLIDEIHILGENMRGAIIEVVISRMKTSESFNVTEDDGRLRFLAISATIPNIKDIAEWLSNKQLGTKANSYKVDESCRPVQLKKIVLGYPCPDRMSDFIFDLRLNYRLHEVIQNYSNGKPTLIFCSTRKSTQQAAVTLTQTTNKYTFNAENEQELLFHSANIKDAKLKEFLVKGVGIHHAGLAAEDRKLIETLFLNSKLKILLCTSTLAIGINLPAHLVIIKSTEYYVNQKFIEYSVTQIQQMIGRAGRPQFDKTGTAVIMTKAKNKAKYESLLDEDDVIESNLHKNLIEHFNNEIVLRTISSIDEAIKWLKSTYLYVRLTKNPYYYGAKMNLSKDQIENYLEDLCNDSLNALIDSKLVKLNSENSTIVPTSNGLLMSKYCVSYQTMKMFIEAVDDQEESIVKLDELIDLISKSKEFEDIQLRTNEKSILNELNKSKNEHETIRFKLNGKIKTPQMKINVLIQSQFSCLPINDFSLMQDTLRITRSAQKLSKCLMEYVLNNVSQFKLKKYELCLNSVLLAKSFASKLWFDSPHILKQFNRIGLTTSQAFLSHNLTSFDEIQSLSSLEIEAIANKNPPFGSEMLNTLRKLPKFQIKIYYLNTNEFNIEVEIEVKMTNFSDIKISNCFLNSLHQFIILVGDEKQNLIESVRINIGTFLSDQLNGTWKKSFNLYKFQNGCFLNVSLMSLYFVGIDAHVTYRIFDNDGCASNQLSVDDEKATSSKTTRIAKRKKDIEVDKHQSKKVKRKKNIDEIVSDSSDESLPQISFEALAKNSYSNRHTLVSNHNNDIFTADDEKINKVQKITNKTSRVNKIDSDIESDNEENDNLKPKKIKKVNFKSPEIISSKLVNTEPKSGNNQRIFKFKKIELSPEKIEQDKDAILINSQEIEHKFESYKNEISNELNPDQISPYFKNISNFQDEIFEIKPQKLKIKIIDGNGEPELGKETQNKGVNNKNNNNKLRTSQKNAQVSLVEHVKNEKDSNVAGLKRTTINSACELSKETHSLTKEDCTISEFSQSNTDDKILKKFKFKKQNQYKPEKSNDILLHKKTQDVPQKKTKKDILEDSLLNLNQFKLPVPIQSKKLDDFRLKFVDHIDTLKLNFPYHETQYKMESSIHEETPHQNLSKSIGIGTNDSVVPDNNYDQNNEVLVNAQLDELFDKSIDENDNEVQENKNELDDYQENSIIPFVKDNKTTAKNEKTIETIRITQSTIDDIKKLFDFDSLLFLKK